MTTIAEHIQSKPDSTWRSASNGSAPGCPEGTGWSGRRRTHAGRRKT